jgi:hypothetical protein
MPGLEFVKAGPRDRLRLAAPHRGAALSRSRSKPVTSESAHAPPQPNARRLGRYAAVLEDLLVAQEQMMPIYC